MGQPIKIKLAGSEKEVLNDIQTYGDQYAMSKWQVRDYAAWRRWVHEQTGNPKFGLQPVLDISRNGRDLGEQIVDSLTAYVIRNEAEKNTMRQRIAFLEMQLEHGKTFNTRKAISFIELADGDARLGVARVISCSTKGLPSGRK